MNFSIPTDSRSRGLLAGALFVVAAVGAYWYLMWSPDQKEIVATAAHASTLDSLNTKIKIEAENGTEAKLRADADRYNSELIVLRRLVPTVNEVPALINAISTAARQSGVDVFELAPDGQLAGDQFDAVKYKLGVTGPYHKVAEFFASVGSLPRIVTPINAQLSNSSRAIERKPGKNEVFIEARFGVLTYVAKTVVAPAKPGGN